MVGLTTVLQVSRDSRLFDSLNALMSVLDRLFRRVSFIHHYAQVAIAPGAPQLVLVIVIDIDPPGAFGINRAVNQVVLNPAYELGRLPHIRERGQGKDLAGHEAAVEGSLKPLEPEVRHLAFFDEGQQEKEKGKPLSQ